MTKTSPHYQDTRELLLSTGEAVIRQRGFSASGLAEILAEAGIPKGSFYYYFKSKEEFGAAVLARYFERSQADLQAVLTRKGGSARDRLLRYFTLWAERHESNGCHQGCFAVKLCGEVSDLSEVMRQALAAGMNAVVAGLAEGVRAGVRDGSLAADLDPERLADSLYALWMGADLAAKVRRSPLPLSHALVQTEVLLQGG